MFNKTDPRQTRIVNTNTSTFWFFNFQYSFPFTWNSKHSGPSMKILSNWAIWDYWWGSFTPDAVHCVVLPSIARHRTSPTDRRTDRRDHSGRASQPSCNRRTIPNKHGYRQDCGCWLPENDVTRSACLQPCLLGEYLLANRRLQTLFNARCNIHISRLCYDVSVCLSVCLWRKWIGAL